MKTCLNCSKELADDAKFCDGCGTKIPETFFCPNCGKKVNADAAFCQNCGSSLAEEPAAETETPAAEVPVAETPVVETPVAETPVVETVTNEQPARTSKIKKKLSKKVFIFGAIGVAVIALIVAFLLLAKNWLPDIVKPSKPKINYTLFLKDKEIFFTDFKEDSSPWQLTAKFNDTGDSADNEDLASISYYLGRFSYMSEDGKYIFFPDKINDDDEGFNLYYKEVATPEAEAVKVDSNIQSYTVNTTNTIVTYIKGESGDLYQYKIGEDSKEKIASEVAGFEVSDDGTKIGYIDSESNLYLKYADKEKEKIASEVSSLEYVSKDFKTAYYVKDGSLYKQVEGEDKVKIASDILHVLKVYDTGEIYYVLTGDSVEKSLMDYVKDDMKDADAKIVEPVFNEPTYPSYPDYDDYYTWDAYYDAVDAYYEATDAYWEKYEQAEEEYYAALDIYYDKLARDALRADLAEEKIAYSNNTLCYYDGKEETVLTDAFTTHDYLAGNISASNAPVISYNVSDLSNVKKVNFSEISSASDAKTLVETAMSSSFETYLAVKGTATVMESDKGIYSLAINDSGTAVYYIDNLDDEKDCGELYRISINKGVVGKPELYDSDVYCWKLEFAGDDNITYFKEFNADKYVGDMYINKNMIDYEVRIYSVDIYDDLDKILYFVDWSSEKECGTLKVYQDEKAAKIADDVHAYSVTPTGQILYLYDYSIEYYRGELRTWNNGESKKISDDVIAIIPAFDSKYRGVHYSW